MNNSSLFRIAQCVKEEVRLLVDTGSNVNMIKLSEHPEPQSNQERNQQYSENPEHPESQPKPENPQYSENIRAKPEQGTEFLSRVLAETCKLLKIKKM